MSHPHSFSDARNVVSPFESTRDTSQVSKTRRSRADDLNAALHKQTKRYAFIFVDNTYVSIQEETNHSVQAQDY